MTAQAFRQKFRHLLFFFLLFLNAIMMIGYARCFGISVYPTSNALKTSDSYPQIMLTKSLVVIRLAESKTLRYEAFVKPSWHRLQFDPQTSRVMADLFVACHPDACHVMDERCIEVGSNHTKQDFQQHLDERHENELLCFYAAVPEKNNESYVFAHSINFLQMEPFNTIQDLNYYDYILRSDADAIFFPGLLTVPPTGDGWVGAGYSGMNLTYHLVHLFTDHFLPYLGPPLRPKDITPSMQSTFYVHKSKFRQFVSVLLNATKTLHDKAFTKEVCQAIDRLPIAHELHPGEKDTYCRWAYWHQGVSSLYGTRVAVDHVLENVTVTNSLDAMATDMDRYDVHETIQAHLLYLKHDVRETFVENITGLCSRPIDTMRKYARQEGEEKRELFDAMEEVYRDSGMANKDTVYYVADVLLRHFHKIACLEKDDDADGSERRTKTRRSRKKP